MFNLNRKGLPTSAKHKCLIKTILSKPQRSHRSSLVPVNAIFSAAEISSHKLQLTGFKESYNAAQDFCSKSKHNDVIKYIHQSNYQTLLTVDVKYVCGND